MSGARRGANPLFSQAESPVTAVGTNLTLSGLDTVKTHCFAGVQFFSDAAGTIPATPTTGHVDILVKTINTNLFEHAPSGPISAAVPRTISWAANTIEAKALPVLIDVATHYKLVITCNEA